MSYAANYYIVGYGDGATIAQQFAMENPTVWAGMATFGELKVSDQYMTEAGNKASLMVENIKANHNIDSGRVYGTGQSMGSMMSHAISLYLPDIFTATGSTSGPNLNGLNENMPGVNLNYDIPYMVIIGDKDVYANRQSDPFKNEVIKEQLNYFINRYHTTSIDQPATYKNGPYNHRVYYNKDGVPMVHYVNVDNLVHANVPAESWMIYDEFLCKFYRNETGKIIYEKGDQEENQQINQRLLNQNTSPLD